jgi:hypothetical protein
VKKLPPVFQRRNGLLKANNEKKISFLGTEVLEM